MIALQQTPSLDTWTSGFLIAVAMGLFLFFVLITDKNKKNRPIAWLVLAFSVILFQYVLYWTGYQEVFPYLVLVPPICYYVSGPLLYLYFLRLYKREVHFNYALHFLPAFLVFIPQLIIWLRYFGFTQMEIHLLWLPQQHWFIVGHMSLYCLACFVLIHKNKEPDTQYTHLRSRWSTVLASLFGLFILSYTAYYVLVNFEFFNDQWDYMISIMMSVSIYAIGYFIYKQPEVFDGEFYSQLFLPIKNKDDSFEQSLMSELHDKLTVHMDREKPFIDNELRLVHLADQLGFSTHLLSKVINKKTGMNFNQFVNDYRLQEAERLLSEPGDHSIKSIYFDVGFNNKATFYNAFKKKYNCTPMQYRQGLAPSDS